MNGKLDDYFMTFDDYNSNKYLCILSAKVDGCFPQYNIYIQIF